MFGPSPAALALSRGKKKTERRAVKRLTGLSKKPASAQSIASVLGYSRPVNIHPRSIIPCNMYKLL